MDSAEFGLGLRFLYKRLQEIDDHSHWTIGTCSNGTEYLSSTRITRNPDIPDEIVTLRHDFMLHQVYSTPTVYISSCTTLGHPLGNSKTLKLANLVLPTKLELSPSMHPVLHIPCLSIPSCSSKAVLEVFSSPQEKLQAFLIVVGFDHFNFFRDERCFL